MSHSKQSLWKELAPKSFLRFAAWVAFLKGPVQWLINYINHASNLDFVLSVGSNPRIIMVWHFLNSTVGNLIFTCLGIIVLLGFVLYKSKQLDRPKKRSRDKLLQEDPQDENLDENPETEPDVILERENRLKIAVVDIYRRAGMEKMEVFHLGLDLEITNRDSKNNSIESCRLEVKDGNPVFEYVKGQHLPKKPYKAELQPNKGGFVLAQREVTTYSIAFRYKIFGDKPDSKIADVKGQSYTLTLLDIDNKEHIVEGEIPTTLQFND